LSILIRSYFLFRGADYKMNRVTQRKSSAKIYVNNLTKGKKNKNKKLVSVSVSVSLRTQNSAPFCFTFFIRLCTRLPFSPLILPPCPSLSTFLPPSSFFHLLLTHETYTGTARIIHHHPYLATLYVHTHYTKRANTDFDVELTN
jgi:hypothetical protein